VCRGGLGSWLDDFEAHTIRELKQTVTEGFGMTEEIQLIDAAILVAQMTFALARARFDGNTSA
jgi:hypothetical protein